MLKRCVCCKQEKNVNGLGLCLECESIPASHPARYASQPRLVPDDTKFVLTEPKQYFQAEKVETDGK